MGGDDSLVMDSSDIETESHRETNTKNGKSHFAIVTAYRLLNQRGIIFICMNRKVLQGKALPVRAARLLPGR
jgi:hypothetical protein